MKGAIYVEVKWFNGDESLERNVIEPSIVKLDGKDVIYHYMIYDLCKIQPDSRIAYTVRIRDGFFHVKMIARVEQIKRFGIICPSAEGYTFMPRTGQSSCVGYDGKLYVYGGNDAAGARSQNQRHEVHVFDPKTKAWENTSLIAGDHP